MIELLARGRAKARMPRSLILEPTRELAAQVAESFERYGKYNKLSMALLIGGVSFDDQDRKLDRGVDVLIATPGRLLDHFERGKLMLSQVQILVMDEADRMLDMGFIPTSNASASSSRSRARPCSIRQRCRRRSSGSPISSCTIPSGGVSPPGHDRSQHHPGNHPSARQRLGQARITAPADARQRGQERDCVLQPQTRRRCGRQIAAETWILGRGPSRRSRPVGAHEHARGFKNGEIHSSSPATSPRAASTSRQSRTSSISTCRFMPTIMSTASDARVARVATGLLYMLATPRDAKLVDAIEKIYDPADPTEKNGRAGTARD